MFSVVIPLYNKELSIKSAIRSVLGQTFQDFEIVIINDGSQDNSVKMVNEIDDTRIRIIHQENQGVSSARNRGVEEAKFNWVAFLDGDDLWTGKHLEEISKMMIEYPKEKVFVTSYKYSDDRKLFKLPRENSIFKIKDYYKEAIKESLIWTSVTVIHKECFAKVGLFNPNINRGEDLDLWVRVARHYEIVKSKAITATYRIEAENRSSLKFNLVKSNVYNYSFEEATSDSEVYYYKSIIIKVLRGFLKNRRIKDFFMLKEKHKRYIKYKDVLLKKKYENINSR